MAGPKDHTLLRRYLAEWPMLREETRKSTVTLDERRAVLQCSRYKRMAKSHAEKIVRRIRAITNAQHFKDTNPEISPALAQIFEQFQVEVILNEMLEVRKQLDVCYARVTGDELKLAIEVDTVVNSDTENANVSEVDEPQEVKDEATDPLLHEDEFDITVQHQAQQDTALTVVAQQTPNSTPAPVVSVQPQGPVGVAANSGQSANAQPSSTELAQLTYAQLGGPVSAPKQPGQPGKDQYRGFLGSFAAQSAQGPANSSQAPNFNSTRPNVQQPDDIKAMLDSILKGQQEGQETMMRSQENLSRAIESVSNTQGQLKQDQEMLLARTEALEAKVLLLEQKPAQSDRRNISTPTVQRPADYAQHNGFTAYDQHEGPFGPSHSTAIRSPQANPVLFGATDVWRMDDQHLTILKGVVPESMLVAENGIHLFEEYNSEQSRQDRAQRRGVGFSVNDVNIPKFDGKAASFRNFWMRLLEKANRLCVSNGEKLDLLRLATQGNVAKALSYFAMNAQGLFQATTYLFKDYFDPAQRQIQAHEAILVLPEVDADYAQLEEVFGTLHGVAAEFDDLGINDLRIRENILCKFPKRVGETFHSRYPEAMLQGKLSMMVSNLHDWVRVHARQRASDLARYHAQASAIRCAFCTERGHRPVKCPAFSGSAEQFKLIRDTLRCRLCLEQDHDTGRCASEMCGKCGQPHHVKLHKHFENFDAPRNVNFGNDSRGNRSRSNSVSRPGNFQGYRGQSRDRYTRTYGDSSSNRDTDSKNAQHRSSGSASNRMEEAQRDKAQANSSQNRVSLQDRVPNAERRFTERASSRSASRNSAHARDRERTVTRTGRDIIDLSAYTTEVPEADADCGLQFFRDDGCAYNY